MPDHPKWLHREIADLLASLTIKSTSSFLEKPSQWVCPGCGRSKARIVAPGQNVDIIAAVHRHHDHIQDLIWTIVSQATGPVRLEQGLDWIERRQSLIKSLERQFCRFEPVDICHACNAVDPAAKAIVGAPKWFSFSPHGIRNMIRQPIKPYAVKHDIDRHRLDLIWDKVSIEIDGLEDRIRRAAHEARRAG